MTFRHGIYYTNKAYESYLFHRKNMVLMFNVLYAQEMLFFLTYCNIIARL